MPYDILALALPYRLRNLALPCPMGFVPLPCPITEIFHFTPYHILRVSGSRKSQHEVFLHYGFCILNRLDQNVPFDEDGASFIVINFPCFNKSNISFFFSSIICRYDFVDIFYYIYMHIYSTNNQN